MIKKSKRKLYAVGINSKKKFKSKDIFNQHIGLGN